jgi:ribose transport system substrate-binding protein
MSRRTPWLIATTLASATVLLAGCAKATDQNTSDGVASGSSSCVGDAASSSLAADMAPVQGSHLSLPPLSKPNPLHGQHVTYIAAGLSFPFSQDVLAGVKEAANQSGADLSVADSGGDVAKAASLMDQAVSSGSKAILLQGVDPSAVSASMRNAKDHGVSVIAVASLNPGPVPANLAADGLSGIAGSVNDLSRRQANFVAADSGCKADVVYVGSSTFPSNADGISQFKGRLAKVCPQCHVDVLDSPLSEWSSQLGPQVRAYLQKNPNTGYVVTVVDDMFTSISPAIQQLPGHVKLVGANALVGTIQDLQSKSSTSGVAATIGTALGWMGWAAMDQAQRVAGGDKAVDEEPVPNRTFTRSNVAGLDPKDPDSWYGSTDYQSLYEQLWHTSTPTS